MQVSFQPGAISGSTSCISITIIEDDIVETTQSFSLRLMNPSSPATIPAEGAEAIVNILDNDGKNFIKNLSVVPEIPLFSLSCMMLLLTMHS